MGNFCANNFFFQYFIADNYFLSFFYASNFLNDFSTPPPPGNLLMVRPLRVGKVLGYRDENCKAK